MRRPRSGIAAELVPLVLILACVAGSLALIVSVHRRVASRRPAKPAIALVIPPSPPIPAPSKPIPVPIPASVSPEQEPEEPDSPPPPTPEDPTPKAVARMTSAEAEQLLEASRADRKAAALAEARKAALAESERWRRRESLVRLQLDSLDTKVRKLENEVDKLALERDALEKELDSRKALASQDRSRPGQAILPHRGVNGTWRRPIVVECSNGMAILRPQGVGFGILDLSTGFGPASNPFVAMVAREAIRIQGNVSPDGKAVVPYIFFLVRPDGIRAYYEARGRLEPLGITFGYELADQDWEIDFPDLDDIKTWDGSAPSRPEGADPLAQVPRKPAGGSPAEDEEFPSWGTSARGNLTRRNETPGGEFAWPPNPRASTGGRGRVSLGTLGGSGAGTGSGGGRTNSPPLGSPPGIPNGVDPLAGIPGIPAAGSGSGPSDPPNSVIPGELSLGDRPIKPLSPSSENDLNRPIGTLPGGGNPASTSRTGGQGSGDRAIGGLVTVADAPTDSTNSQTQAKGSGKDDPANAFVWPAQPKSNFRNLPGDRSAKPSGNGSSTGDPGTPDQSSPVLHSGPFSRPLAMGLDPLVASGGPAPSSPSADVDPTQPDGSPNGGSNVATGSQNRNQTRTGASGSTSGVQGSNGTQATSRMIGSSDASGNPPPSGSPPPVTVGMGGMPPLGGTPPSNSLPESQPKKSSTRSPELPEPSSSSIVDRRFEIVVVCSPRGVIVQPGGYRVTADALNDRDDLMKKQMVALVKARRTADPKTVIEPRIRFLVQPGGDKMFWAARSQFLLSGLNWPMSTQVADPDRVSIIPSESW